MGTSLTSILQELVTHLAESSGKNSVNLDITIPKVAFDRFTLQFSSRDGEPKPIESPVTVYLAGGTVTLKSE